MSAAVISHVGVGDTIFGNDLAFSLIAGPCAMESRQHAFDMAGRLKACWRLSIWQGPAISARGASLAKTTSPAFTVFAAERFIRLQKRKRRPALARHRR